MKKVMVVAVHPDDETLGCGGTLLRLKEEDVEIHWLVLTDIAGSSSYSQERVSKRDLEIKTIKDYYSFTSLKQLEYLPAELDKYPMSQLVSDIKNVLDNVQPDTLFLPFYGDAHSDHRVAFEALYSCTKSFRAPYLEKIYMMETLSETEFGVPLQGNTFVPNFFVSIDERIDKKIEAMKIYEGEMGESPFPRSEENIKALAKVRGSQMGSQYAEAFMILKELMK